VQAALEHHLVRLGAIMRKCSCVWCPSVDHTPADVSQSDNPQQLTAVLQSDIFSATESSAAAGRSGREQLAGHGFTFYPTRIPQSATATLLCCAAPCQVPVLHGDCVFDSQLGVTILSGDTIMRGLAQALQPRYCVFLTDVAGLYSKPPEQPGAQLIPAVEVAPDGSWSVAATAAAAAAAAASTEGADSAADEAAASRGSGSAEARTDSSNGTAGMAVQLTAAAHDTTGGIATKVAEAAGVVLSGCPVVIAQAGTASGAAAVLHGPSAFAAGGAGSSVAASSKEQLQGTVIRPAAAAAGGGMVGGASS
jgi:isopentenyl phosphate kinase